MARFTVTTGEDINEDADDLLSLREAMALAAANEGTDRIVFRDDVRTVELTRTLEIRDVGKVIIDGDGDGDGLADTTITGNVSAALHIAESSVVELLGLRFADITASGGALLDGAPGLAGPPARSAVPDGSDPGFFFPAWNGGTGRGGGSDLAGVAPIRNDGDLLLARIIFEDNRASGSDGGNGGTGGTGGAGLPGARDGRLFNGTSGGDGGAGGSGGRGGDAAAAVINRGSLTLRDVGLGERQIAEAGDGGDGGRGGAGGAGGRGADGVDGSFGRQGGDGTDGGAAGDGGDGRGGGTGGDASGGLLNAAGGVVTFRTALGAAADVSAASGAGGAPGAGGGVGARGAAGAGGDGAFLTPGGDPGSAGATGSSGSAGLLGPSGRAEQVFLDLNAQSRPEVFNTLVFAHVDDRTIREGRTFDFSIGRVGSDDSNFTVSWEIDLGRGVGRSDFGRGESLSGEVEFVAGGPDVRTISIDSARDRLTEGTESFRFELVDVDFTAPTSEIVGFGTDSVRARILDRNGPSSGDDSLRGTPLADRITGKSGDDTLRGSGGSDKLIGSGGEDRLYGGNGRDELRGGVGDDRLYGGKGADVLNGQKGADVLKGGGGSDVFVFGALDHMGRNSQRDEIRDFQPGRDFIDLTGIDANPARGGRQDFSFIGSDGFSDRPGELRYSGGVLRGDVDGDGRADFDIEIANRAALTADDFLILA